MTTAVVVQANHGRPVRVTSRYLSKTVAYDDAVRVVPAGIVETFYIHESLDLIIHEMQAAETDAELTESCAAPTPLNQVTREELFTLVCGLQAEFFEKASGIDDRYASAIRDIRKRWVDEHMMSSNASENEAPPHIKK
jgi:hypothetical protein